MSVLEVAKGEGISLHVDLAHHVHRGGKRRRWADGGCGEGVSGIYSVEGNAAIAGLHRGSERIR